MKLRVVFLIASCILIAFGCKQEDYVRDYPQILSTNLKSNTTSGISIEATMSGVHIDQITDHGFLWTKTGAISVETSVGVHLGKPTANVFSADIRSQLRKGIIYTVKSFLKTDKAIVYGEPITFESFGSEGAVIHSVSPTTITPGDLVTITGERFGTDASKLNVWFHLSTGVDFSVGSKTVSDAQITFTAPKIAFQTAKIAVSNLDDGQVVYSEDVNGKIPVLSSLTVTDVCHQIQVNGQNLLMIGTPRKVTVNQNIVTPLPVITDTSIILPASLHAPVMSVQLTYDNYSLSADLSNPVLFPTITAVPASFGIDNTFVVQGTNFPSCGGLTITSQGAPDVGLTISNQTSTQFTVTVSGSTCRTFTFAVSFIGKTIYSSPNVAPPPSASITSVSPQSGKPGDHITITGTNLRNISATINAGGYNNYWDLYVTGTLTQMDAQVTIPYNYDVNYVPNGDMTLTITGCGINEAYPFHLDLIPITITDVNPKTAIGGQDIVLTGTNFLSDPNLKVGLVFGDNFTEVPFASVNDTQITLSQYYYFYTGSATVVIHSYGREISSTEIQLQE